MKKDYHYQPTSDEADRTAERIAAACRLIQRRHLEKVRADNLDFYGGTDANDDDD